MSSSISNIDYRVETHLAKKYRDCTQFVQSCMRIYWHCR